ncbi:MAG: tail fiber domain-containing protein, partial [Pseudobdellovibrio sp.]
MKMRNVCGIVVLILAQLLVSIGYAAPKTITIQTKIFKPDGHQLEATSVNFQFTTLTGTGTCVLYVEQFNAISMAGSGGLAILNLGGGNQIFSATGTAFYTDVFNNSSLSMNCQGSGTYVPSTNDRRRVIIQFNDGSAAGWQTLPSVDVNSVPYSSYAGDAEKLVGHAVTDFALNAAFPDCVSTGKVLTFNGTSFSCVAGGGGSGTVTSVTSANTYLTVATTTTTPVITANVGAAANTLAAGDDTRIVGAAQKANNLSDLASATTAVTNLGGTVTGAALFTTATPAAARTTLG